LPAPSSIEAFLERITLHLDAQIRVIDKPAGLAVQKGTGNDEHLDGMLMALAAETGIRERLVHRLDKDTSGCLVLARSREAAAWLGREFMRGRVAKTYWAIVHGVPEPRAASIDLALVKVATPNGDRVRPALPHETANAWTAETEYEVLAARANCCTWLRLVPRTGGQHQLRAHLAAIGHPILGDAKYPPAPPPAANAHRPLHLLARSLAFRHPNGEQVTTEAPPPAHMLRTMTALGFGGKVDP
jgi:23S rRNA pseudouridine955/2504/2580 synthase